MNESHARAGGPCHRKAFSCQRMNEFDLEDHTIAPSTIIRMLISRGALLVVAAVVFIATILFYTTGAAAIAFSVLASDGMLAACWTAGACCCGSFLLRPLHL